MSRFPSWGFAGFGPVGIGVLAMFVSTPRAGLEWVPPTMVGGGLLLLGAAAFVAARRREPS